MTTVNRNRVCPKTRNATKIKNLADFSKVGGLSNHIKLLREIIIFPLVYGNLYKHFNIKAPRGVLFFGPPGTGKTLVAGALANELNREANGKVTFFQRKGADILDKWVGESERKLKDLFNQATKSRPSVIFFDELDGLAPVRSQRNDHIHCSVVTILLALMDGLDNTPGVIIIGATNRIDAIDPALRRPGRFDKELYFPLPSVNARREILQVHTNSWDHKPSPEFLDVLSELTSGCCGSDLQALCADAFLCCLKRLYPNLHKPILANRIKIEPESLVIDEVDFLKARMSLVPTNQRFGNYRVRKLSQFIKPLLQRQVNKIMRYIQIMLPQFTQPFKKFLVGNERYIGRLILKGTSQQGLTVHVVPAILQTLEHLPCYTLDHTLFESNIQKALQNVPSILLLPRIDDWWDLISESAQLELTRMLEDLHAGLPLLLIATYSHDLPDTLQEYFYSNSSIVVEMENPTSKEREEFFAPLFFGNGNCSAYKVLKSKHLIDEAINVKKEEVEVNTKHKSVNESKGRSKRKNKLNHQKKQTEIEMEQRTELKTKRTSEQGIESSIPTKRSKICEDAARLLKQTNSRSSMENIKHSKCKLCRNTRNYSDHVVNSNSQDSLESNLCSSHLCPLHSYSFDQHKNGSKRSNNNLTYMDLIECTNFLNRETDELPALRNGSVTSLYSKSLIKQDPVSETCLLNSVCESTKVGTICCSNDPDMVDIRNLWNRTAHITSDGLAVTQLEFLYDTIAACITLKNRNFDDLIAALERTLINFENLYVKSSGDLMDNSVEDQ